MNIIQSVVIEEDLGSFKLEKDYICIGYGVQSLADGKRWCINVIATQQEKYREIDASNAMYLGKQAIKLDLSSQFNGDFAVCCTLIQDLPLIETNKIFEVHVYAEAYAKPFDPRFNDETIVYSEIVLTYPNIGWEENLDRITDNVYNELRNQMALKGVDMNTFSVIFSSFAVNR